MSQTQSDTSFTFGDYAFDVNDLTTPTIVRAVQRTIAHVLSNEVAAKVSAAKAKHLDEHKSEMPAEAIATLTTEHRDASYRAIMSGEWAAGVRGSSGPRVEPIEAIKRRLATVEIAALFKQQGLKVPTGDGVVTMKNGAKFTRDQLIARMLASPKGASITKAAEAELAAKARAAKLAAESAKSTSLDDIFGEAGDEGEAATA